MNPISPISRGGVNKHFLKKFEVLGVPKVANNYENLERSKNIFFEFLLDRPFFKLKNWHGKYFEILKIVIIQNFFFYFCRKFHSKNY